MGLGPDQFKAMVLFDEIIKIERSSSREANFRLEFAIQKSLVNVRKKYGCSFNIARSSDDNPSLYIIYLKRSEHLLTSLVA
jgi:hypothetical protein